MPARGDAGLQWLGVAIPSTRSSLDIGSTIEWGGKVYDVKFSLKVRQSVMRRAAQPFSSGKLLSYAGQTYRIASVKTDAPGASFHLTLIDPNR